jgi:hypothetical protein
VEGLKKLKKSENWRLGLCKTYEARWSMVDGRWSMVDGRCLVGEQNKEMLLLMLIVYK